ncbi:MAG: tetratricopeptide repeat protein [Leptospiraceae bacterium]|nr:tetratricopeptide repeat protein [Leptospiraceae bacterium]MCP5493757.1 tetratricopeptide repeat protein [Leptospiraceae bacterium]
MKKTILILILSCASLFSEPIQESYALESQKQYVKALEVVEGACSTNPHDYLAHLRAGWLAYLSGQMAKSLSYYQKAVVIAPDAIEPRLAQFQPLSVLQNYKQIQVVGKSILRIDRKNYTARKNMAYALYMTGNYKVALQFYIGLVKEYPADMELLIGLAWTYLRMGDKKNAYPTFLAANRIYPGEPRIVEGLQACK